MFFVHRFLYVYLLSVYTRNILSFFFSFLQNGTIITFAAPFHVIKKSPDNNTIYKVLYKRHFMEIDGTKKRKEQTKKPILINNASSWPISHRKWHVLNAIGT